MPIFTIFASNPAKTYWSPEPSQSEEEILKNNPAIAALDPETRATVLGTMKGDDVLTTPKVATIDAMTKASKDWNNRVAKTREAKKLALIEVLSGAQSEEFIEQVRKTGDVSPKELLKVLTAGGKAAQTTLDFLEAQHKQNAEVAAERLKKGRKNEA